MRSLVYDRLRGPDWPSGYDARSLRTELTETWSGRESAMADQLDHLRSEYAQAVTEHDMAKRVVWAGTGVGDVDGIVAARDVVNRFPAFG